MTKTIIVTGARGFIGRYVTRLLAGYGYSVIGVGNGHWSVEEQQAWGVKCWINADVTVDSLKRSADAPYAIFHLAGGSSVPQSSANPLADFKRTVGSTANVLEFVRAHSPATRVVYASSASVYGITAGVSISENQPAAPISIYGMHKYMSEQMIALYARQYCISSAVVRLFSVYGSGLRKQLLWDACRKLSEGSGTFMGTGNEIRDWLHVSDAAELIKLALEKASPVCPVINGGTGEGVSVKEIVTEVRRQIQCTDVAIQFSGVQRPGDPTCFVADISLATTWGWRPVCSWRNGLSEYAAWWRQEPQCSVAEREADSIALGVPYATLR